MFFLEVLKVIQVGFADDVKLKPNVISDSNNRLTSKINLK